MLKQSTPAGSEARTYDQLGRLKRIHTPQWNLTLDDYDAKGNLLAQTLTDPDGVHSGVYTYDGLDNLTSESLAEDNHFTYDSLRNCVSKNQKSRHINHENQLVNDGDTTYIYDDNGNLLTDGSTTYAYNALNQLTLLVKDSQATSFTYDGLGRCVAIGSKHLLYFDEQELGSTGNGAVQEFRLAHPNANEEKTFAIELTDRPYFTTQDAANNICALYSGNSLVQWERFSTFGNKTTNSLSSPWGYANRRLVGDLVLYTHRFYSPALMRWFTTDPSGYEDSLNLYQFVCNNPFRYRDPNGCFVFVIPIIQIAFGGSAMIASFASSTAVCTALGFACTTAICYGLDQFAEYMDPDKAPQGQCLPEEEHSIASDCLKYGSYAFDLLIARKVKTAYKCGRLALNTAKQVAKQTTRKRFKPETNAEAAHSRFRRDHETGKITHYETFIPQTNPRNPNQWESALRYDGSMQGVRPGILQFMLFTKNRFNMQVGRYTEPSMRKKWPV